MNITNLEAILFFRGEAISVDELSKILGITAEEVMVTAKELQTSLQGRGIELFIANNDLELKTASSASTIIEKIVKEDLDRDLGRAGLETLTIILYEGPISRRDIDYIRGVNSQFIVKSLLMRGLVKRIEDKNLKGYKYEATTEALGFLGINKVEDLPEYENMKAGLKNIITTETNENIT